MAFTFKAKDVITVDILDGGLIKLTSAGAISQPNHMLAERMISAIKADAGGPCTVVHLKKGFAHTHHNADGSTTTHSH